jgi:ABC-type nitrate/sulfonate/bicarbonate transport system substrate-binding protein
MSLLFVVAMMTVSLFPSLSVLAQEKFRFPIGESSKTLSYGPLWVAAKMGFFEKEGLDVPIVTMRGSPLTTSLISTEVSAPLRSKRIPIRIARLRRWSSF